MQTKKTAAIVRLLIIVVIGFNFSCQKSLKLETDLEEQFYFQNGKSNMPVWIYGNGKSKIFILTLHGGPGLGRGLELRVGSYAEKLEEKYAMVYWDQRAQGSSQGNLNKSDVTIDNMVEDVHTLIGILKARYGEDISVFLMGHSWGGTLSTAYLIKEDYQTEVKGWINIAGTPNSKFEQTESVTGIIAIGKEQIAKGSDVSEWQDILNELLKIDTTQTELSRDDNTILHKQEKRATKLLKSNINESQLKIKGFKSLRTPDPGTLLLINSLGQLLTRGFYKEIQKIDMIDDLSKITIPALIQGGKYDFGPPASVMKKVYDEIGSASKYLNIYEDSEHAAFETEPDLFNTNLINFIELHK